MSSLLRSTQWLAALALMGLPSMAAAQSRIDFVSRSTGGGAGFINATTCASETWTFRLVVAGATAATPSVFLTRANTCASPSGDAQCVPATGVAPTRVTADCTGNTCWEFTVESRWLFNPRTGACVTEAGGTTRVFAFVGDAVVASPRVPWDTLSPARATNLNAAFGAESEVRLTWSYPTVATAADAAVDDVVDASDAADVTAVADASDAAPAATFETVRRFWVLCDPVPGGDAGADLDGGSACATGGFTDLDGTDATRNDALLLRYANQCGVTDGGEVSATPAVSLSRLAAGRPYRFAIVAEDLAGNRSGLTRASTCSSSQTYNDFWEQYRGAGGGSPTGCAAIPGASSRGVLVVFAAMGALALRRRRVSAAGGRGRRSRA
jgi:hypothetical protein